MRVLLTGTAGFIGFHVARRLIASGHLVVGLDGMTPYYDVRLKQRRHEVLGQTNGFRAHIGMLEDEEVLLRAAEDAQPDVIIHLAAQAGVRYSIENPGAYVDANLVGLYNVMEVARRIGPKHLLVASTSSVYGGNQSMPFRENEQADWPLTLYAATKKAGEALTHSYSHLWKIPTTCFRFFTVYGPWGRPDMALFKFVDAIEKEQAIDVYGEGRMRRDFTYIDDLVEGIIRLIDQIPGAAPATPSDSLSKVAPWRVVNIAGGTPVGLLDFISVIEQEVGKSAIKNLLPMQQGDVVDTFADATLLKELTGFNPGISVSDGVREFVRWYRTEYAQIASSATAGR